MVQGSQDRKVPSVPQATPGVQGWMARRVYQDLQVPKEILERQVFQALLEDRGLRGTLVNQVILVPPVRRVSPDCRAPPVFPAHLVLPVSLALRAIPVLLASAPPEVLVPRANQVSPDSLEDQDLKERLVTQVCLVCQVALESRVTPASPDLTVALAVRVPRVSMEAPVLQGWTGPPVVQESQDAPVALGPQERRASLGETASRGLLGLRETLVSPVVVFPALLAFPDYQALKEIQAPVDFLVPLVSPVQREILGFPGFPGDQVASDPQDPPAWAT